MKLDIIYVILYERTDSKWHCDLDKYCKDIISPIIPVYLEICMENLITQRSNFALSCSPASCAHTDIHKKKHSFSHSTYLVWLVALLHCIADITGKAVTAQLFRVTESGFRLLCSTDSPELKATANPLLGLCVCQCANLSAVTQDLSVGSSV